MPRWSEKKLKELAAEKGYELHRPYPDRTIYYLFRNEAGRKVAAINPKYGDLPQFRSLKEIADFLTTI